MALDVSISGSAKLRSLAEHIRAAGNTGLGREMGAALRKATEPVERSIESEYRKLPAKGGYATEFSKSLRFRRSVRSGGRQASVQLTTFADGTKQRRDIMALESGRLRHPVYGRSRPGKRRGERHGNPWAVTKVRGGFHHRGTDKAADLAEKEMIKVLDDYASKLIQ